MAYGKSLDLLKIGTVTTQRIVKHPWEVIGKLVTKRFQKHKIGKVIHAGGTRIGKFDQ